MKNVDGELIAVVVNADGFYVTGGILLFTNTDTNISAVKDWYTVQLLNDGEVEIDGEVEDIE